MITKPSEDLMAKLHTNLPVRTKKPTIINIIANKIGQLRKNNNIPCISQWVLFQECKGISLLGNSIYHLPFLVMKRENAHMITSMNGDNIFAKTVMPTLNKNLLLD